MARSPTHRLIPRPHRIRSTGDDTPARNLWRFVWRLGGWHQVVLCLLGAVVAALSMAPLELQRRIVDEAVKAGTVEHLVVLGGVYLAVVVGGGVLKFGLQMYQSWLGESAVRYLRSHLTRLHREKADRGDSEEGRAVEIIGAEVDQLGGFVGEGPSELVVQAGMLVSILGYMFATEPKLAAFATAFMVPQLILAPVIQRIVNRLIATRIGLQRGLGDMIAHIAPDNDAPGGSKLSGQLDRIYNNRMLIYAWKLAGKAGVNLINGLAPVAALVGGGYMVIQGQTSLGVVVAFLSGFSRLSDPIRELIAYYRLAARANVQHHKIAQWM